jgi:hypothetical protein
MSWDEIDDGFDDKDLVDMRCYWMVPERWAKLSAEGQKMLTEFFSRHAL